MNIDVIGLGLDAIEDGETVLHTPFMRFILQSRGHARVIVSEDYDTMYDDTGLTRTHYHDAISLDELVSGIGDAEGPMSKQNYGWSVDFYDGIFKAKLPEHLLRKQHSPALVLEIGRPKEADNRGCYMPSDPQLLKVTSYPKRGTTSASDVDRPLSFFIEWRELYKFKKALSAIVS